MSRLRLPAGFRAVSFLCAGLLVCLVFVTGLAAQQNTPSGPRIWLQEPRSLPVKYVAAAVGASSGATGAAQNVNDSAAQILASGQGQPLAMATGDFDRDGVNDLVVGYAVPGGGILAFHRGNLDAFAPQSDASFQAIGRGEFPSPFHPDVQVTRLAIRPDFLAVGNFTGQGDLDLVVAARGGNVIYLFAGNGTGKFANPQIITLTGGITALAAGDPGNGRLLSNLAVGVSGPNNSFSFLILGETGAGFGALANSPLSAPASNISFGDFGDGSSDAAFLSGGGVFIFRTSTLQLQKVSLPVSASALALGSFIYDRNGGSQIALLASDGSVHIAVRDEFDPRVYTAEEFRAIRQARLRSEPPPLVPAPSFPVNGWKIEESFRGAAALGPGQTPVFFRTRVSSNGADDVMVLNASAGQLVVISHPDLAPGATTFLRGEVSVRPYLGSPVTALPMRTNVDGRPGVMALHQGQIAPSMLMPLPDPTFTVNTTNDTLSAGACLAATPNQCSLREAIIEANATPGTDTIMVPAGTYTLTLPRAVTPLYDATTGTLNVNDSVNIIGAGQNTTIIQAGTTAYNAGTPNGVDMLMAVNEDLPGFTNATASISNLTLQNGHNRGAAGVDGDAGCLEFDTGGTGNNTLTLTNVTIQNCDATDGNGGGIAIFNTANGTGLATISNSIIQGNSAKQVTGGNTGTGGGIFVASPAQMSMSNSQVINNLSTNTDGTTTAGRGGGIAIIFNDVPPSKQTVIHASTISGNQAAGKGGGIYDEANLVIDQNSFITNNSAGTANVTNLKDGGGIWMNVLATGCPGACTDSVTLTKVTISGNSAAHGNGGGIATGTGSAGGPLTMSFSRLAGNTVGGSGSNLNNSHTTVTATNNWWGTNNPSSTINNISATTTFDPFIVLTHTASPNKIRINQSTTLTADMSKDNHGVGTALVGNLDQIVGLPITFKNPVDGSIPDAQPEALDANAQATATFNAGGVAGGGKADAVVDQATVTADIIVLQPPSITKSFSPTNVAVNAASTITFSITNPNVVTINASFVDTLPANLVVAATPNVVNNCGGSVSALAAATHIDFTNAASLAVGTCTIKVDVQSALDSIYSNSVTIDSTDAGNGNTAGPVTLTVINPPSSLKAFGAASIPLNGTTSLTFTLTSTNTNLTLNGVAFTDTLPTTAPGTLIVANPNNLNTTCNGAATATAGSSSVSLTGASLAPGASCTISLNVTGTFAGVAPNSVQATSTDAGGTTGNTSNASVTVIGPPTISKAFGAASIPLNGTTTLSFTITNPNTASTLSGVGFSDTLPAGVVVAATPNITGSCGSGTITVVAGGGTISLTGGTLTTSPVAGSSCTFSADVTGTTAGSKSNTTGAVTSVEGGTGATSNTAPLTVVAPPSIAKAFGAANIPLNGTTTLTFTITNPAANTTAENGIAFSDTLTNGLQVANTPGVTNSCGGAVTATANTTTISLSGGSIATPNTTCTIVVNVTGTQSGTVSNTTGAVSSTNGGTGATSNTANLIVADPPTISKAFGAATIPLNGTTSLTFTITNPNTGVGLTGIAFTDILPGGLVVATPNNLNSTCGGTPATVAGSGQVSLSGGNLAASANCIISVNITGTTAGAKSNTTQAPASTEGGTGVASNTASLTVLGPPVIIKSFGAASVPLNGSTSLSFTIQNNNTNTALTGVGFSDTLPAGLVVSTPNGLTGSCGGGTITATQATNVISLTGATLAQSSSCAFSVNVTGTAAGAQNNTTGNVTSVEGGTGGTASASIAVVAPPSIAKAFGAAGIPVNGTTTLTFTITNPPANTVAENGVAFTDNLPAGIAVATPTGLANTCGGTPTAVAGGTSISLTGGSIATPNTSCTVSVNVTANSTGSFINTTGAVSSTNGGTGNTATATLSVAIPPTISKLFLPDTTVQGGTSLLSFTITNPNSSNGTPPPNDVTLTGIQFTDTLPAGLIVATPSQVSNDCGGTVTADPGSSSISLSGGTLAPAVGLIIRRPAGSRRSSLPVANGSCFISVKVKATATGALQNTTGPISANESGQGATSNQATLTVGPAPVAPTLTKAFGAASIPLNGTTTLTFTMINSNSSVALTNISFTDTLPSGLVVASPNGLPNGCADPNATVTGDVIANPGSNTISMTALALNKSTSCSFFINVTGTSAGTKNNTTGNVTATFDDGTGTSIGLTGGTASAGIAVVLPPSIAKAFNPTVVAPSATSTLTITITNPAANTVPQAGVTFTDTLPSGLVVATPNGLVNNCGGAATAAPGSGSVSLTGGAVAINSSCTVIVNVTGPGAGKFTNTTGAVSSTNGGTGNTASAQIRLGPPLQITENGGTLTVTAGGSTSVDFTVDSSNGVGTVTFTCSGLPALSACVFTPPAENQITATVTMTLGTTGKSASTLPLGTGRTPPVYAALLLPLLGLVGIGLSAGKGKKARLRLALCLGGLVFVLATFAGCAGGPHGINGTPPGTYTLTVTATGTGATASTTVTLKVL
jgi:CSLREA domain-containing protein/uncharacterized repeat protein (TIGR01451 family)